jgi:signal peptidase I
MDKKRLKKILKKVWYFIWEDNSIWSWLINVVLAFIIIKFIVYTGLGLLLATSHPIVAVVSESMEHKSGFDEWWDKNDKWYLENDIDKDEFSQFSLRNGFNKGDIIILIGKKPEKIPVGDIIVFRNGRPDPIIHRVVEKWQENDEYFYQTKGDNNQDSIKNSIIDETEINEDQVIGKALFKIPFLGYVKILFVEILRFVGITK